MKTKKIKKQPKQQVKPEPKPKASTNNENVEDEKPFDFGGLPQRGLKKNLGCG